MFYKTYSRLRIEDNESAPTQVAEESSPTKEGDEPAADPKPLPKPPALSGTLQSFVNRGRPVSARIVTELSKTLGFSLEDEAPRVITGYDSFVGTRAIRVAVNDDGPGQDVGNFCRKSRTSGPNG